MKKVPEFDKDHILNLEKTIQIYVAFYNNDYAAVAKHGKNELFNRDLIDSLITAISADRVLEANGYYKLAYEKISLYRKCRRSKNQNPEFLHYLGFNASSEDQYESLMQQYVFMNTADLLLLNAFRNLKENPNAQNTSDDDLIKLAISLCKEGVTEDTTMLPSATTKNSAIFAKIQKLCSQHENF